MEQVEDPYRFMSGDIAVNIRYVGDRTIDEVVAHWLAASDNARSRCRRICSPAEPRRDMVPGPFWTLSPWAENAPGPQRRGCSIRVVIRNPHNRKETRA